MWYFIQVFIPVFPYVKVWSHFIIAGRAPLADLALISTIITSPLTSLPFRPLLRSQGTKGNFQNGSGKEANRVRLCPEQSQGRRPLSGDQSLERWWWAGEGKGRQGKGRVCQFLAILRANYICGFCPVIYPSHKSVSSVGKVVWILLSRDLPVPTTFSYATAPESISDRPERTKYDGCGRDLFGGWVSECVCMHDFQV